MSNDCYWGALLPLQGLLNGEQLPTQLRTTLALVSSNNDKPLHPGP